MNQDIVQKVMTVRNISLFFVVIVLGTLAYVAATHGRFSIKNLGDKAVHITQITNGKLGVTKEVSNGAFLRSGTYVIKNDFGGFPRSTTITIPRWWQTRPIEYQTAPNFNISRTAALTYENYFRVNSKSISLSTNDIGTDTYTIHSDTDAFGGQYTDAKLPEPLLNTIVTNTGDLLGITDRIVKKYSFTTGSLTDIVQTSRENDRIFLQRSSNTASDIAVLYQSSAGDLDIISAKNNQSKRVEDNLTIDDQDVTKIDANDTFYAFVSTQKETKSHDSEQGHHLYEFFAHISHIGTSTKKQFSIGQATDLTAIAISPSGNFLGVLKDGAVWVYDTKSGAVEFAGPFQDAEQLIWHGNVLYSISPQKGISLYDTETKQLLPIQIAAAGNLTLSKVTVVNSKLYVTAFSSNSDSDLPDGYEIYPSKESDDITKRLSSKLPYTGAGYDISYLGNTIYIRTNYFPLGNTLNEQQRLNSIREAARDKLNDLFEGVVLRQLTITFTN